MLRCVGRAAYEMELPASAKIHRVMHVSQLKKAIRETDKAYTELPGSTDQPCRPERILETRNYLRNGVAVKQLLIQWTGMEDELATWEDEQELKAKFPEAPAWVKPVVKRGEC